MDYLDDRLSTCDKCGERYLTRSWHLCVSTCRKCGERYLTCAGHSCVKVIDVTSLSGPFSHSLPGETPRGSVDAFGLIRDNSGMIGGLSDDPLDKMGGPLNVRYPGYPPGFRPPGG